MDLDDSFTEHLLQKVKERKVFINEKKKERTSTGKKRAALVDEHQLNSENALEESPKRQCTKTLNIAFSSYQDKENVDMQEEPDAAFIPIHSASKVRGLAALKKTFSNDDDEKVASGLQVNKSDAYFFSTNSSDLCTKQKSRFANLAADIQQWEDDTHQPTLSRNVTSVKVTKNQMPLSNTPTSASKTAFAMKLYYTNSKPSNVSSEKHVNSNPPSGEPSTGDKKGLGSISACKSGNIQVGSVGSRQKICQTWNQAVAATLETPTSVKSPVKPVSEFTSNRINENLNHNSDQEQSSGDESIDENDFAENYNNIKSDSDNKMEIESPVKQVRMEKPVNKPLNSEKVEISKLPVFQETNKSNVDPAELPLSARKALFEKVLLGGAAPSLNEAAVDKLSVAQRAAMFEKASKLNTGAKATNFKEPSRIAVSKFSKFEKNGNMDVIKSPIKADVKPIVEIKASPVKMIQPESITAVLSPTKNVGNHTRSVYQKLIGSSGSTSQDKEAVKVVEERKKEISSLVNHWEKLSSSSSVESNSEQKSHSVDDERISYESDRVQEHANVDEESESGESEDDMNDETYNDVAEDEMYEGDDNEVEDDKFENGENVFFRQENESEVVKEVKETCDSDRADSISLSSQNYRSEVSSVSGISSYTDDSNYHASNSGSCSSGSSLRSNYFNDSTPQEPVKKVPKTTQENANPEIPLKITPSFYRKQKPYTKPTTVRTIVRREQVSSPESPPAVDYRQVIEQRIEALQNEVKNQGDHIRQASQALNLCSATAEFSGSVEQVEFEKLLLIATQKRQACLNEITRLKTCLAQGGNVTDGTGTLTISDLQLPLKREFVASQLEGKGNDTVHYFLCLIRHGSQVIVTQMMSSDERSSNGTLHFSNHIQLRDLPPNFSVIFEVYALQTKKEALPHEKKYHIKKEHSKIRLTPKGRKLDGKMPAISSPGGPDAVRSPSFGVVGFTRFTLQNHNKKTFTLDKVPFTSPLDGVLRVNLLLLAEHKVSFKGFLTMFEDISGFGAWQRRWCALDVNQLTYWKYPDDEDRKEPIGSIDLRQCITDEVRLVHRDECARPHTFQFVTVRPSRKEDKDTLISKKVNTLISTKHLLSADTKDERIMWCNRLNEALTNIRIWDPQAMKPNELKNINIFV